MKPIGPLMREHRLIERMVGLLMKETRRINRADASVDFSFIDLVADFFGTYADRTHHGKEEDILFNALEKKSLAGEHKRIMDELVADHVLARKTVSELVAAAARLRHGELASLPDVKKSMKLLVELYPKHIDKEDKHFFYPVMEYFSRQEQDAMLEEFREFDRAMIHEKYLKTVEALENR